MSPWVAFLLGTLVGAFFSGTLRRMIWARRYGVSGQTSSVRSLYKLNPALWARLKLKLATQSVRREDLDPPSP